MANFFGFPSSKRLITQASEAQNYVDSSTQKARDARITAFALTMIALVLMATSFVLFGLGTLSPEVTMGLGIIPYVSGIFIESVAICVFTGALAHLAISSVRDCQKNAWMDQITS